MRYWRYGVWETGKWGERGCVRLEPCSGLPVAELFVKRLYMMITESAFGGNGSACCYASASLDKGFGPSVGLS